MHVLNSTIWDLTEIAHVVQYIWEIGELMFGRLRGLVPLRSSWKPSNTKLSPRLPFPLLSSPVIWAVFVQRYRSPPALSPAQLCGHLARRQITGLLHELYGPEWKSQSWNVRPGGNPRRHAGSRWVTGGRGRFPKLDSEIAVPIKPRQILLYHPRYLAVTVLAFKGQTAPDDNVFISCSCSFKNNRICGRKKKTPWCIFRRKSTWTDKYVHIRSAEKTYCYTYALKHRRYLHLSLCRWTLKVKWPLALFKMN